MGLFSKKPKVEEPVVKEEPVLCDCCGKKLSKYDQIVDPEDNLEITIAVARRADKSDIPVQCEVYHFKYGEKNLCGWCFSKILLDITGEVYGPEDFLCLEDYKINHINKMLTEMPVEEMKRRKQIFDDKMKEVEEAEAAEKAKAEEEWLKTLK